MWKTIILAFAILHFTSELLIGEPIFSCFDFAGKSLSGRLRNIGLNTPGCLPGDSINPVFPPTLANCPELPGAGYHIVQPHETLYGISRAYTLSVTSLVSWNKIKDPDKILICQKIWLRKPPVETTSLAYKGVAANPAAYSTPSSNTVVRQEVYWYNKSAPSQYVVNNYTQPQIYNTPSQPFTHSADNTPIPGFYNNPTTALPKYASPVTYNRQPALATQSYYEEYIVREGETINSIAFKFNIDARELSTVNNKVPDDKLIPGQRLLVQAGGPSVKSLASSAPTPPSECPEKSGPGYHIVQVGESLLDIAKKYGVSDQEIIRVNKIMSSNDLKRCMRINLPPSLYGEFGARMISLDAIKQNKLYEGPKELQIQNPFEVTPYTIKENESLVSFAKKKNINPQVLASLNNLSIDSKLLPNQLLSIPKD